MSHHPAHEFDREQESRELAEALARLLGGAAPPAGRPARSPWDLTMPAGLDLPRPAQPFEEPLSGMAMREVREPHVFGHYFGASPR